MKKILKKSAAWYLAAFVAASFIFMIFGMYVAINKAELTSSGAPVWVVSIGTSDVAAWVQAIGAISAIIGAFEISSKQSRDNIAREISSLAQRKSERDQSVRLVIDHCYTVIVGMPGPFQRREDYERHKKTVPRTVFTNLQKLLSEAPLYDVSDEKIVTATMLMMDVMDSIMSLIDDIDSMHHTIRITSWPVIAASIDERRSRARVIRASLYPIEES